MAYSLVRSAGNLQRLAQASAASTLIASEVLQPASFTSLLAWHRQSTGDHRKTFSSDDKQDGPHSPAQEQASASKQAASEKSQGSSTGKVPVTKDVRQDPLNILGFITNPLVQLTGRFAVWTVKNKVETSFDEAEFLEGAKDAWVAVNSCMNHNDVETLKDMVHPRLMDTFRTVFKEQAAENKFFESQELDVQHAHLAAAMFLDPAAPPVAAEGTGPATQSPPVAMPMGQWGQWAVSYAKDTLGGSTLGLLVKFSGVLHRQLVKDQEGTVISELEDRRSQLWLFVRGPLPDKLPVRELDAPWQLFSLQ